jgi:hypothetical protein
LPPSIAEDCLRAYSVVETGGCLVSRQWTPGQRKRGGARAYVVPDEIATGAEGVFTSCPVLGANQSTTSENASFLAAEGAEFPPRSAWASRPK